MPAQLPLRDARGIQIYRHFIETGRLPGVEHIVRALKRDAAENFDNFALLTSYLLAINASATVSVAVSSRQSD